MVARSDFNDDGDSDILWRGPTGQVTLWEMDGSKLSLSSPVQQGGQTVDLANGWTVAQSGDFNGDNLADILWRGPDGEVTIWNMDGPELVASSEVMRNGHSVNPGHNWTIQGTGDFNGDGKTDILWRSTADAGAVHIWTMDNADIVSSHPATLGGGGAPNPGSHWNVAGTGDFNGDGMSDIFWRGAAGEVGIWQMNGTEIQDSSLVTLGGHAVNVDNDKWSVAGIGDFNGDGNSDVLWRSASGEVGLWLMDGAHLLVASFIERNGEPLRLSNARWSIAGTGDYNGDGKADILWRGPEGHTVVATLDGSDLQSFQRVHDSSGPVILASSWHIAPTT